MSLSDEERRAIVDYRVEKAHTALSEIRSVMPMKVWGMIANRMYYALYYAASALLINDAHTVNTHKSVIALINQHYVKEGTLSKDDGRLFANVFAFRQGCDYDDFYDASEEDIKHYLPLVEALVDKMASLIYRDTK